MAKRTVIVDDLTGDEGARTRVLRFDGVDYVFHFAGIGEMPV